MRVTFLLLFCMLCFTGVSPLFATGAKESKDTPSANVPPASTGPEPAAATASSSALGIGIKPYTLPTTNSSVVVETSATPFSATSIRITPQMIDTAAGAYEDPARYFQMLPGVAAQSDQRNDFMVRGGNPSENLFVIDNIDVHSISQMALSDSTGGFVSMIDNAAVQSMTLHTGGYDAKFDDHLSSVVEISTIPDQTPGSRRAVRHMTEAGIAGIGGLDSRPFGERGSLFVSAREGILQYVTNDIGMNGVPHYRNSLVRGDSTFANGDKVWGMALTGIDSMAIHPDPNDRGETNPVDVHYSGWRNTTGFNWQHGFSPRSFGVFTLANSEQAQTVVENAQQSGGADIYNEQTHDGDTSLKTQFTLQASERLALSGGATETLTRLNYNIAQPDAVGMNPYDANPDSPSATNVHRNFSTADDAAYAQAAATLPAGMRLTVAARAHHWALGNNFALTPKASLSVPLGRLRALTLGYADYAQMPAYLYMLSFSQNSALRPIRSQHLTAAVTLVDQSRVKVTVAAYQKRYRDYPVSALIPQLSLANIADTFGQVFLMFPMVSQGLGQAAGAELAVDLRPSSRVTIMSNLAYSRTQYSGLDGILRNGGADRPLVGNLAAVIQLRHGLVTSLRYSGASGRPYTPDDMVQSNLQNRDVYDLTRVNALRSSSYGRLDFRIERTTRLRGGELLWHAGLDNALNRKNFYDYEWEPNNHRITREDQMPIFPDGGVKYTF